MNNKNNLDEILYGIVCIIATIVFVGYLAMGLYKVLN